MKEVFIMFKLIKNWLNKPLTVGEVLKCYGIVSLISMVVGIVQLMALGLFDPIEWFKKNTTK